MNNKYLKETMTKVYQQGDLLLTQLTKEEQMDLQSNHQSSASMADSSNNFKINLAFGEVTGHSHRLELTEDTITDVKAFYSNWVEKDEYKTTQPKFIEVIEPAELRHEEHGTIMIPPGFYKISGVKEFDYVGKTSRQVRD